MGWSGAWSSGRRAGQATGQRTASPRVPAESIQWTRAAAPLAARAGPDESGRRAATPQGRPAPAAARNRAPPPSPSLPQAAAQAVGKKVAELAKAAGVEKVAFDRGGFTYHGRVQALADAAREAGLSF